RSQNVIGSLLATRVVRPRNGTARVQSAIGPGMIWAAPRWVQDDKSTTSETQQAFNINQSVVDLHQNIHFQPSISQALVIAVTLQWAGHRSATSQVHINLLSPNLAHSRISSGPIRFIQPNLLHQSTTIRANDVNYALLAAQPLPDYQAGSGLSRDEITSQLRD